MRQRLATCKAGHCGNCSRRMTGYSEVIVVIKGYHSKLVNERYLQQYFLGTLFEIAQSIS
jgi:hypothetical protein